MVRELMKATLLAPVVVFSGDDSDKLTAPDTNTSSVCLRAFSFDLLVKVECDGAKSWDGV